MVCYPKYRKLPNGNKHHIQEEKLMLHKRMKKYISSELTSEANKVEIYQEEKEFIKKYDLVSNDITIIDKDPKTRFLDAYIERGDKQTEETLAVESFAFLEQPMDYLQKHKNEFLYIESNWLEIIGVDAISLE